MTATPDTPGAAQAVSGPILGRALLDNLGQIWAPHESLPDRYRMSIYVMSREQLDTDRGPVREVLLVTPAAARVIDAAQQWRDAVERAGGTEYATVRRALAAAVDALGGGQPLRTGGELVGGQPLIVASGGDHPAAPLSTQALLSGDPEAAAQVESWPLTDDDHPAERGDDGPVQDHDFLPVAGHPDDDECTFRNDGTDLTYCGRPKAEHNCAELELDDPAEPAPEPAGTTLTVPDSPKMLRETLCVAQGAIGHTESGRRGEHIARLGRLIAECDRHRPLGPDGKHGDRHTPTCGCRSADEHAKVTAAFAEPAPEPDADGRLNAIARQVAAAAAAEPGTGPRLSEVQAAARAAGGRLVVDVEPGPEPAGGPGWHRAVIADAVAGLAAAGECTTAEHVEALLADRDWLATALDTRSTQLHDALTERDTARAELDVLRRRDTSLRVEMEISNGLRAELQREMELASDEAAERERAVIALAEVTHSADLHLREADRLRAELAEYQHLFELAWTRTAEATALWRAEAPGQRALIQPDLGALLRWLMDRAATARRDAAADALDWSVDTAASYRWTNVKLSQLAEWATEVRSGRRPVPGSPEPDGGGDDADQG